MNIKKHLPNAVTALNLFCGCIASLAFLQHENELGILFVIGGLIFDFLDGFVARALKVQSEIGKQLDSLADMITFGFVPGVIMYIALSKTSPSYISDSFELIFSNLKYLGFSITVFSAIRLAKFNIDDRQTSSFVGLPTPANTILILTIPLVWIFSEEDSSATIVVQNQISLLCLTLISSYLLIAELSLLSLKFKNFSWKDNKEKYILLISSVFLLWKFSFLAGLFIILLYLIISIIHNITKAQK